MPDEPDRLDEALTAGADLVSGIAQRIPRAAAADFARWVIDPQVEQFPVFVQEVEFDQDDTGFEQLSLPQGLAARLFGISESIVENLSVPLVAGLSSNADTQAEQRAVFGLSVGDEWMQQVQVARQFHPDLQPTAVRLGQALLEATTAVSTAAATSVRAEAELATEHGRLHLAVAVVSAALTTTAKGVPDSGAILRRSVTCGLAVELAFDLLRASPAPEGYRQALLERARETYLYPRVAYTNTPTNDEVVYFLEPEAEKPVDRPSFSQNGLVQTVPGGFAVLAGPSHDAVYVSLHVDQGPPAADEGTGPEMVEISWTAGRGGAGTSGMTDMTPPWPGDYRIRVVASGRDRRQTSLEVWIWQAPTAPALVLKAKDHVGAVARGELDPASAAPEEPYGWIWDTELEPAATVTVIPATRIENVARAFRAARPINIQAALEGQFEPPTVILHPVNGAVLAVEVNGWVGAMPRVLADASVGGRAASVYWNVNRCNTLSLAANGTFVSAEELLGSQESPAIIALMSGADPDDPVGYGRFAFVAMQRYTGVTFTQADLDRALTRGQAFEVAPTGDEYDI